MRALLALVLLGGCMPDDWDGTPYDPSEWQTGGGGGTPGGGGGGGGGTIDTGGGGSQVALVGTWVSEGDDISDMFAAPPFEYQRITADFRDDGSYTVTSVDGGGTPYELVGTYVVDTSTTPAAVSLSQTSPYDAEAEGIWAVQGSMLTYEVVQTVPDFGFSPPTPDGGFGSTAGSGLEPGMNVQVYRR